MSVVWLRLAAALYSVGLVQAILFLLRRGQSMFPLTLQLFQAGVILHGVSIVEHSVAMRHLAANNFFETASLCAFLFAAAYLFVERRYQFEGLSVFAFPLIALLTMASAMGTPVESWSDPRVRNIWLLTHILLVLVGYSCLLVSAGAAVFYLLQERRIKRRAPRAGGGFLARLAGDRLPPLETLDRLITWTMSIGFVSITLAVIAGSTWAFIETGTRWIKEAKIAVSLVTWAFYLVMVFLRVSAGWRGRKAAILSLTVLGFAALTWAAHVGLRPLIQK
ncbi:MAG: cytochrome c biogenesis protein CcsA [Bryobacteraceae bacterium]|nr:cytochrome c biogenesis protein CcsA [Bryobacteraceae bacterium]